MKRKLKPPILGTEGILGIIAISVFLVLMTFSVKLGMGFGAIVCICAAFMSLVVVIRTSNLYFIPMLIGQLSASVMMLMTALLDIKEKLVLVLPFVVLMAASFTVMFIFFFQRKLKWRTREMLELAAQPVVDKTNGLTQRPLQTGQVDGSREEILEFASFIRRNLIAIPVFEQQRVTFILNIPMNKLLQFSSNYEGRTWVVFNFDGKVTVNIQQTDYFMYKELLAFDQLCQSLGDLFINFFEEYRRGEESRIIYQLNALNLNIITEG